MNDKMIIYHCLVIWVFLFLVNDNSHSFVSATVCPAGYSGPDGRTPCRICQEGTYTTKPQSSWCTSCTRGSTTEIPGATTYKLCNVCVAGYRGVSGRYGCKICQSGTYSTEQSSQCTSCPNGTSTEKRGATSNTQCNVCAAGYRGPDGRKPCVKCQKGTYSAISKSSQCFSCVKGRNNKHHGATYCYVCAAGYSGAFGRPTCRICQRGTYSAVDGSSDCTSCPNGRSTQIDGATSSEQCNVCAAGYRGSKTSGLRAGLPPCVICPIGSYSEIKSRWCKQCLGLATTRIEGATSSLDCVCRPGSYGQAGLPPCALCAKGYYQGSLGRTICNRCPRGTTTVSTGATNRQSCA